jgi:membrane fusion protein, multidrug efflux system
MKLIKFITITIVALLIGGCGGNQNEPENNSVVEEESVPVRVEIIETKLFQKNLSFFGRLSGIKESTKGTAFGGKIEAINGRVGQSVAKNQVIVQLAEDNPGMQYLQAKSAYENAEKTYRRVKSLLDAGETSQASYDGAETQFAVSKRNYEAQKQLLFIESPFAGTIVDIQVNEGDNVKGDAHLFTIAQLDRMKTKVWASESEIGLIKKGMPAVVNGFNKEFKGKVVEVSLSNDPMKQGFAVEIEFDNPKRDLLSGITTDIKIIIYENKDAVIIPRNLINRDKEGRYVFVEENGIAVKRYITNGNDSGISFEVTSGIQAGDRLITHGSALLEDGKKVKIIQ